METSFVTVIDDMTCFETDKYLLRVKIEEIYGTESVFTVIYTDKQSEKPSYGEIKVNIEIDDEGAIKLLRNDELTEHIKACLEQHEGLEFI